MTHRVPPLGILILIFATLFVAYTYTHQKHYNNAIPISRLDLLHAVFSQGVFQIDTYHKNTPDKAVHDGHYYSDKAPGMAISALPAFSFGAWLLKLAKLPLDSDRGWLVSSWIACAGSIGIVTAIGGVGLFIWLTKWVEPLIAYVTTMSLFLGAAPLPYATLLMPCGFVVGLLGLSLGLNEIRISANREPRCFILLQRDYFIGFCCGLALASEYTAGIAVLGTLYWFAFSNSRRIPKLFLGAFLPLLTIPAYQWICFGTPFTLAYHHEAVFTQMHTGFFGIGFPPKPQNIWLLIVSERQGLLFWSPVILMSLVGYVRLYRLCSCLFWISFIVPTLQILIISGYFYPSGGGTLGPRFLAPILINLALPIALGISRFPLVGCMLASLSIALNLLATSVDIVTPHSNRLLDYFIPCLIYGEFSHNLGMSLGLYPHVSVLLLLVVLSLGVWFSCRSLLRWGHIVDREKSFKETLK